MTLELSSARNVPRRVLVVARQFVPLVGGTERQAWRLAASLASRGARVTVLTTQLDPRSPVHETVAGVECVRVRVPRVRFLGTALWTLRLSLEVVRRSRETDVIHVFWAKESALAALLAGRLMGLPVVVRPAGGGHFGEAGCARRSPLKRLVLALLRNADAFVALSSTIRDELRSLGVPLRRIHVIPNGIPIPSPPRRTARPPLAVFVGRLCAEKNLDNLLRAWRIVMDKLPAARLELVGDGPLADPLKRLARDLGLESSVTFTGNVVDVEERLSRARVFVQPSISEGMSAALLEALAAGLPAVVTATSGAVDLVTEDVSGKFVPPDDPTRIAKALTELLVDEERARSLGEAAYAAVASRCDIQVVTDAHLDLYARLAGRGGSPRPRRGLLMVIATLDNAGTENQMTLLSTGLAERGRAVAVACLTRSGPLEGRLREVGITIEVLHKRGKLDFRAFARLFALVRRFRRGIIHTWLFTSNSYGRFAALLARAPRVVASERSLDPWKGSIETGIDRAFARVSRVIVANARAVKQALVSRGVPADRIVVIPNGVRLPAADPEAAAALRKRFAPAGEPVIGYVGRISSEKRLDTLIEALHRLADLTPSPALLVVGDGPDRFRIESLAEDLIHERRAHFVGEVVDVADYYACMDLLVLPSRYEGLPNALIEAAAAGLPVVACDVGGVREVVSDGESGLIVASEDPEALAQAIRRLLENPALRAALGEAARRIASEKFSLDGMIRAYDGLYQDLLGGST
ncbi:MAG: glycosyltransferase [Planctomycetota bacterium]